MSKLKYLTKDEVPKEYHSRIRWDEQEPVLHVMPSRQKTSLEVNVHCNICGQVNDIPVNDIRNWCRGYRKGPFPGTHRACKYPGRSINSDGYVLKWAPDHPNAYDRRYVLEHVFVMSEYLGRQIEKYESVHHIDGDKQNNDISNLQLRVRYHGKGQAWECLDCGGHNIFAVPLA